MNLPIEHANTQKYVSDLHCILWDKTQRRVNFKNGFVVESHSHFLREGFHYELEFSLYRENENKVKQFVLSVGKSDYKIEINSEKGTMNRIDFNPNQYILTVLADVLFDLTCEDIYDFINWNCSDLNIIQRILK